MCMKFCFRFVTTKVNFLSLCHVKCDLMELTNRSNYYYMHFTILVAL